MKVDTLDARVLLMQPLLLSEDQEINVKRVEFICMEDVDPDILVEINF